MRVLVLVWAYFFFVMGEVFVSFLGVIWGFFAKKFCKNKKTYKRVCYSRSRSAGHRARVPPDPIPNSEVKPRSVPNCSVVLGHVNLGKLATFLLTLSRI